MKKSPQSKEILESRLVNCGNHRRAAISGEAAAMGSHDEMAQARIMSIAMINVKKIANAAGLLRESRGDHGSRASRNVR
jgi:hypothetical protein